MAEKKPTPTTRLKAERIQGKLKSERAARLGARWRRQGAGADLPLPDDPRRGGLRRGAALQRPLRCWAASAVLSNA